MFVNCIENPIDATLSKQAINAVNISLLPEELQLHFDRLTDNIFFTAHLENNVPLQVTEHLFLYTRPVDNTGARVHHI